MADTLPHVNVLDKVYPGWRDLVANSTIKKFMSVKLTGALTTELFGISHNAGSEAAVVPGLSNIMLASPYPNFAMAMADCNAHRLQIGDQGWFGTMVPTIRNRGSMDRYDTYDWYKKDTVFQGMINAWSDIDFVSNTDKVKFGSWSQGNYEYQPSYTRTYAAGTDLSQYQSTAEVWRYAPGSETYDKIYGPAVRLLSNYGYEVDSLLPIFVCFGNLQHTNYLPQSHNCFQDLCLPGRKIIKIQVPATVANVKTIDTFNNTVVIAVSVKDSGSQNVLQFYTANGIGYATLTRDHRYQPGSERTQYKGIWSFAENIVRAYGPQVLVDGVQVNSSAVNDGLGVTGPMLTDANGSWTKKSVNFTPLLGIPGNMHYHFFGKVTETEEQVVVDDKQVTFSKTNIEVDEFLLRYNFSWYENYYKTGFDVYTPRASNIQTNTLESWKAVSAYDLAVYGSTVSYTLNEQMVKQTNLYRAYKKAQDKACRDDKFLELKFDDQNTYRQMLAKSKASTVFMNLVSPSLERTVNVTYESGTIKVESGSVNYYPSGDGQIEIGIIDERYMSLVLQGVARVPSAESMLGLIPSEVEFQVKENTLSIAPDYTSYTGANSNNVWIDKEGAMINGYPVISAMNIDQRVIAMGVNATQFQAMLAPSLRLIESLTATKMWTRFR